MAIVGGGHKTTGACTDGLLIDMRRMNAIRIDAENKVAYVQGGAHGHSLDVESMKYGRSHPFHNLPEAHIEPQVSLLRLGP